MREAERRRAWKGDEPGHGGQRSRQKGDTAEPPAQCPSPHCPMGLGPVVSQSFCRCLNIPAIVHGDLAGNLVTIRRASSIEEARPRSATKLLQLTAKIQLTARRRYSGSTSGAVFLQGVAQAPVVAQARALSLFL